MTAKAVRNFRKRSARLLDNDRGTSLVEFGLVLPFFLVLLAGLIDLGRGWSEKYLLQQAVNRTLEIAQAASNENDYSTLKTEAATAAGVAATAVTFTQWLECGGTKQNDWDEDCNGNESARFIKISVVKSYRPIFGTLTFPTARADGTVPFTAHATLRVR